MVYLYLIYFYQENNYEVLQNETRQLKPIKKGLKFMICFLIKLKLAQVFLITLMKCYFIDFYEEKSMSIQVQTNQNVLRLKLKSKAFFFLLPLNESMKL